MDGHIQKQTFSFNNRGFTIVELLIVIIVIAILAAIVVVAYNGIQGRASDTAVQADLRNIATLIENYNATNGVYPNNSYPAVDGLGARVSQGSYNTSVNNLILCSTNTDYAIAAVSKSGKIFYRSTIAGNGVYTWSWTSGGATTCPNIMGGASTWWYWGYANGAWAWAK